jgi:hypothetical protein
VARVEVQAHERQVGHRRQTCEPTKG